MWKYRQQHRIVIIVIHKSLRSAR